MHDFTYDFHIHHYIFCAQSDFKKQAYEHD